MKSRPLFLPLWGLAVVAITLSFVLHLSLRGRVLALGYEIGTKRAEQARLRELQRVFQLEVASYKTPERVELIARTLLGMDTPPPERRVFLVEPSDSSSRPPPPSSQERAP